LKTGYTVLQL